ncbi:POK9 protein, partial [Crypturellus undulatus]|nr:POK9 protein [Crypturellus undulatus]
QLRETVSKHGLHSEAAKQMLEYLFGLALLSPDDCKRLAKLICSPAQRVWGSPATMGSLGIDLATSVDVVLVDSRPIAVPTGWRKLDDSLGALILGRSSAGLSGIIVVPGVVDADSTGEVSIVMYTLQPPIVVAAGSRLAQVVPLANLLQVMGLGKSGDTVRGDRAFGSSGPVACFSFNLRARPTLRVTVAQRGERFTADVLMDTGVDVTMISRSVWPEHWPLRAAAGDISGLGGQAAAQLS